MLADLFGRILAGLSRAALLASLPLPVGMSVKQTLIRAYTRLSNMGKTIRVSDEFHSWLETRKREDESMEDALRRLTRGGPHPSEVAGLLTPEEAEEAKEAVEEMKSRKSSRYERAREAFSEDK